VPANVSHAVIFHWWVCHAIWLLNQLRLLRLFRLLRRLRSMRLRLLVLLQNLLRLLWRLSDWGRLLGGCGLASGRLIMWLSGGLADSLTKTRDKLPVMDELICEGLEGECGYYGGGHVCSSLVKDDAHWPLRA